MVYAGIVMIVKVTLMLSAAFDLTNADSIKNLRSYGFFVERLEPEKPVIFNWERSLLTEFVMILLLTLYLYFHNKITKTELVVNIET